MTLGERIKKVRKDLDLTQQEFANRIGSTQNVLANYETGRRNPSSSVINNICKTFNVSEEWLRTGEGEKFNPKSSAAMEALARERGLTHSDFVIIEKFLSMKPESRLAVAEYMLEVAAALNSDDTPLSFISGGKNADIDTEVAAYRSDLRLDEQLATKQEAEAEVYGEKAKALAKKQYLSEKKPESQALSAKESDAG